MPLFAIIGSALNVLLGWLFRAVVVKFVIFTALFAVVSAFAPLLAGLIPQPYGLNNGLSNISPTLAYFIDIFAFKIGLSMIISAYLTRFIIRRIPVIG